MPKIETVFAWWRVETYIHAYVRTSRSLLRTNEGSAGKFQEKYPIFVLFVVVLAVTFLNRSVFFVLRCRRRRSWHL